MKKTLLTSPTWDPVTLQEAKDHLRVSNDEEDSLIMSRIRSATIFAENYTRVEVTQKEYTVYMDHWQCKTIFRASPLQSVVSIKYYDSNNELQTLPESDYRVDNKANWPYVLIDDMPSVYDKPNCIEIVIRVGESDACNVDPNFKTAILMIVGNHFSDRQDTNLLQISKNNVPMTSLVLLDMCKNGNI
jgi:uncharacterized phiE125 gp8 family phage protein